MSILGKSILVGTGALCATFFLILTAVPIFGDELRISMFINGVIGCYSIGSPVSYYCMKQTEKYKAALKQSEELHKQLEAAHSELQRYSRLDIMTGLLNRDAFFKAVEAEKAKNPTHVSTMMISDIDCFKQINDTWGHLAGDQAIMMVAQVFLNIVGTRGVAGRIGGEEFAFFLSEDDGTNALILGEEIRSGIEQLEFYPAEDHRKVLTISTGVASASNLNSTSDVMRRADLMLYRAKAGGRNCVRVDGGIELPGLLDLPSPLFERQQDLLGS